MTAPRQLHLVDATYEVFRAYHAMPSLRGPDGREVGALRGLVGSLRKLLRAPGVTHVACATDRTLTSFRNALYPGYKTGDGVPPDLLAQLGLVEELLPALGLVVWPMDDLEADDALATAAARYRDAFDRVVVCSPDKDLAQCVEGERVVLWDRRREVVYDEAGVRAKWGVAPASIPDWLALTGDAADGFPGVPGWGAKSAAAVLAAHGHLDAIPADPAAWTAKVRGAARLAASLAAHREDARLFLRLATLRRDAPLAEGPDDLAWRGPGPAWPEVAARIGARADRF